MSTVDLNIFSNLSLSGAATPLVLDIIGPGSAIRGVEKAAQYFVTCLLTQVGSATDPTFGTSFLANLYGGGQKTNQNVFTWFQLAASDILTSWSDHTSDDPNEKLAGVELTDIAMDPLNNKIRLSINLVTEAGSSRTIVLPLATVAVV